MGYLRYRYVIAAGIGHPVLLQVVFRDICEAFPNHPVIVVAEYADRCEVVAAHSTAPSGRSSEAGEEVSTCEVCGAPLDGDHPHLCNFCAPNIDRWTKEAEEGLDLLGPDE